MFQSRTEAYALVLPAVVFAAAVFLLPVADPPVGEVPHGGGNWSIGAYVDFFSLPLNRVVFFRSFRLGATVTAVAAVVGYAAAFAIVNLKPGGKGRMIGLVILPLMISPVARTYAWIVILGRTGIVNKALGDRRSDRRADPVSCSPRRRCSSACCSSSCR